MTALVDACATEFDPPELPPPPGLLVAGEEPGAEGECPVRGTCPSCTCLPRPLLPPPAGTLTPPASVPTCTSQGQSQLTSSESGRRLTHSKSCSDPQFQDIPEKLFLQAKHDSEWFSNQPKLFNMFNSTSLQENVSVLMTTQSFRTLTFSSSDLTRKETTRCVTSCLALLDPPCSFSKTTINIHFA